MMMVIMITITIMITTTMIIIMITMIMIIVMVMIITTTQQQQEHYIKKINCKQRMIILKNAQQITQSLKERVIYFHSFIVMFPDIIDSSRLCQLTGHRVGHRFVYNHVGDFP